MDPTLIKHDILTPLLYITRRSHIVYWITGVRAGKFLVVQRILPEFPQT